MRLRNKIMVVSVLIILGCGLLMGLASAEDNSTTIEDPAAFGLDGFPGQLVSALVWVAIGIALILITIGIIDVITDKMKHNWLNLEEFANNPTAMAIFAGSIVIGIAIIIHASVAS